MNLIITDKSHHIYAQVICASIEAAAQVRGTGIAKRSLEYICSKMEQGDAVIALDGDQFAGFCYIETWDHGKFVANSGLIVHEDYRNKGLAKKIKQKVFDHSRKKYPTAKVFSITTGLAVMKLNSALGYKPVTFSELTNEPSFWKGCQTCKNYDILQRTSQSMCLCTGMLFDPKKQKIKNTKKKNASAFRSIKASLFLKKTKQ
ncbi:MAG: GNAT family N-acetyltransferase [Flavobacteriaceae bacterium]|jgi:N-acetylglutamate synthase-like GNAT family acetyltransferase|tara:strand:- start:174 stop:782 length:609 start_codon:yes stop_codon:yes gene_type:complete